MNTVGNMSLPPALQEELKQRDTLIKLFYAVAQGTMLGADAIDDVMSMVASAYAAGKAEGKQELIKQYKKVYDSFPPPNTITNERDRHHQYGRLRGLKILDSLSVNGGTCMKCGKKNVDIVGANIHQCLPHPTDAEQEAHE